MNKKNAIDTKKYPFNMNTTICKGCGDEVDEDEALNGYCGKCVDKFVAQCDPEPKAPHE